MPPKLPARTLDTRPPELLPLRFLAGVGPARAEALARVGLRSVWDLLHELPRLAPPAPPLIEHGPLPRGASARLRARVISARPSFRRGRGMGVEAELERVGGGRLRARFFNAGWLRRRLLPNEWYLWEGRVEEGADLLLHPAFSHLPAGPTQPVVEEPGLRTVYRATEGFTPAAIAKLVGAALTEHLPRLRDPSGELADAEYQRLVASAHHPSDERTWREAARALASRELRALAWRLQERRAREQAAPGRAWRWEDVVEHRARARLPFALTSGQEEALAAIRADMRGEPPMCRLLQGDVGSGKTALAFIASLMAVAEGAQAWLLAPTAILAEQHHAVFARCLAGSRVSLALLTGATRPAERAAIRERLAAGELDLLIGTHALLEEDVRARSLGLVVIDEQHRFGVAQRAAVAAKAASWQPWRPDLLLLTATPIPRTLALTVYGDLPVSRIAGAPPGRGRVTTELVPLRSLAALDRELDAALAAGGRAFVVCPRKEDDARGKAFAAAAVHRHLSTRLGGEVRLMHGDLPDAEKSRAMADFTGGAARVLVTTTVVEVGIDVPEATLLAVLDADRFGLAQLHQLRGRIGRGAHAGRCVLFYRGDDVPERLRVLAASADGLAIAEADLAERGPGELLGTSQHGAFALRIADLARDLDLLQDAHERVRAAIARAERMPDGLRLFAPDETASLLEGG